MTRRHTAYTSAELAAAYDAVYQYADDIPFWLAAAAAAGDPLLELGCGSGRVTIPLAEAGHTITGLDRSEHMLERLRARLDELPAGAAPRVTPVNGDMTAFDLGQRFAGVFCAFNSFHHLRSAHDQLACLASCRAHVGSDGILVLDLFNPDPAPDSPGVDAPGGPPSDLEATAEFIEWTEGRRIRRWMSACEYDRSQQTNECEMTYEIVDADGSTRRITESFPLRLIYRFELEHLLARAGFHIVAMYGGYDRAPFADDSVGMITVAAPDS